MRQWLSSLEADRNGAISVSQAIEQGAGLTKDAMRIIASAAPKPIAQNEVVKQLTGMGYKVTDATSKALIDGLVAWPRLFIARLVVSVLVLAGLVALVVPGLIVLVRLSFVDALVVVDGAPLRAALRASNALTVGRRPAIFWTLGVLFAAVFSLAMSLSALAGAAHHFVVQVLTDCVIAVTQTVFTIALFLFYREARIAAATSAPAPPAD